MSSDNEEWILVIGCVFLLKHPRGYAQQLERALQRSAADESMERAWRSVEDRPVEVFVWFHEDDAGAKSIPHPGDISIRALKTTVRVRMTSSAAWTGTTTSTAAAVAEDHRLIVQALERRYGVTLLAP
ncbi:hypothetical protein AB2L27_02120 [Kineococcus sp. LSe6-4]|uniref:Uncharacterized protein n=1 Tax=Kineococcus halophytocola TaxID=3234027 RepID=A0ABV4GW84_9ACTN